MKSCLSETEMFKNMTDFPKQQNVIKCELTLEGISLKKLHEGMVGGGTRSIGPLSSTFDINHSIDFIFGANDKLPLYF